MDKIEYLKSAANLIRLEMPYKMPLACRRARLFLPLSFAHLVFAYRKKPGSNRLVNSLRTMRFCNGDDFNFRSITPGACACGGDVSAHFSDYFI